MSEALSGESLASDTNQLTIILGGAATYVGIIAALTLLILAFRWVTIYLSRPERRVSKGADGGSASRW